MAGGPVPPDRQDVVTLTYGCEDESCANQGGYEWQLAEHPAPACPRCGGEMIAIDEFVPLSRAVEAERRAERAEAKVKRLARALGASADREDGDG